MKRLNVQSIVLLVAGMSVMGISFVLANYFSVNDFTNGLLKGVGIGFALLSLIIRIRKTTAISANLS